MSPSLSTAVRTLLASFLLATVLAPPRAAAQPFVRITGTGPHVQDQFKSLSAGWSDFDGDGDADLCVGSIGDASLYRNDGLEVFVSLPGLPSDTTADLANTTPIWGDFDNDGDPDLYRCVFTRDSLGMPNEPLPNRLYRNDGGTFVEIPTSDDSTYCPAASWVDYDGDGDLDLFAVGAVGYPDLMYRNDGGTLVPRTGLAFLGTTPGGVIQSWTDYDGDGDQDLYVVNHGSPNEVWKNLLQETGVAESFVADTTSGLTNEGTVVDFSMSWGDYDNDGDLDGFLATTAADRLFRNDGGGSFKRIFAAAPVQGSGTSSCGAWGDYDNDGDVDLFVPHPQNTASAGKLWRNDGGGTFVAADTAEVGDILDPMAGPQAAEWADYDSDGDLDLYAVLWLSNFTPGGAARRNVLCRNDGTGNHWLRVRLEGSVSNRSGIGGIVRVYATVSGQPTAQMREVSGSPTAFEFQRELRTHFGLGDATGADSVVVEWPSGAVQTVTSVAADQTLVIQEAAVVEAPVRPAAPGGGGIRFVRPNPFRRATSIGFTLTRESRVEITVYDVAGRQVRRLLRDTRPSGDGVVEWDGVDDMHAVVGPGIYFVHLRTPDGETSRKALRLR